VDGYMIDVQWDGQTLRVKGKNKAARIALAGENHEQDIVVSRDEIASVKFRDANTLANGNLDVRTEAGQRYQLHFRKKQRDDFRALAQELGAI
jgi:hypothetical protein